MKDKDSAIRLLDEVLTPKSNKVRIVTHVMDLFYDGSITDMQNKIKEGKNTEHWDDVVVDYEKHIIHFYQFKK